MTVDAFDGDLDLQDFQIEGFIDKVARLSTGRAAL